MQQERFNLKTKEHFNKKLKLTTEDEQKYQNSHDCWIRNEKFDANKVRDHCHIKSNYRGAAYNQCNLKPKIPKKLPIIFHNLEGHDGHLIFRELNNFDNIDIQVILKTSEKYMSIIVNRNNVSSDSNQFYKGSLDSLASNLEDSDFKHLMPEFPTDQLELLKRKDAYPYEWVDSYEKFKYPSLPEKNYFYSSIKDGKRDKSDEQYLHLKYLRKEFNFNTFRDFHNHYLKTDGLLLADTFEKFISTTLENYN